MKWRVGGKVPLNVYEGDSPVFQCHTPEDATRIVALLNTAEEMREALEQSECLCPSGGLECGGRVASGTRVMKTPPELDRITDAVLAYRPKDKQPKRRKKKRKPNAKKS
jgi:transposase